MTGEVGEFCYGKPVEILVNERVTKVSLRSAN